MEHDNEKTKSKRKKKRIGKWIAIVLVFLLLIGVAFFWYQWKEKQKQPFDAMQVTWSDGLISNPTVKYLPYHDGFMRVSRDGIEAMNSYGSLAWNISYDLNDPIAASCKEYAAVGDLNRRMLYMMDGTGALYWKQVSYPIKEVEVSSVGVTAVRMQKDRDDYIQLVQLSGDVLVEIKTVENRDGFPIDMALSEDGTKLVTSYLVLDEEGKAKGALAFYNFGEVGQNFTNNLTGIFQYEQIIPRIEFLDNETLCACFSDGIDLFSVPQLPNRIQELRFDQEIFSFYQNEDYLAVMVDNQREGTVAKVLVYDKKGALVFSRTIVEEFNDFLLSKENLVFYNADACLVMGLDGRLRYNGLFDGKKVTKIFPTGVENRFMLLEENTVSTIQLIHRKDN